MPPKFSSLLEKDPRNLLRLLMSVALVSIALILSFAALGIHHIYSGQLIDHVEDDAVHVSLAIMALENERLLRITEDGSGVAAPDQEALQTLDRRLRFFLVPFDIVKIKIFDAERRIVYSTDPTIVGLLDRENERLANALAGENDSKLERKESVLDLEEEQRIDVDVVETYVPIFGPEGRVIGSFEIYRDVTRYRDGILETTRHSVIVLALILITVFGASFVVVKIGTDQLERVQHRLKELATKDPLTGVLNRREIIGRTRVEISRMARLPDAERGSIGVIMLDVDHFKKINDTYGHAAGDHVLREIAERIQGAVRKSDLVGRFGGEEFLTVLPGASLQTTRLLAERIGEVIRSGPFFFEGKALHTTVSLGIAVSAGSEEEFSLALRQADEALYNAKNAGRDRVSEEREMAGGG